MMLYDFLFYWDCFEKVGICRVYLLTYLNKVVFTAANLQVQKEVQDHTNYRSVVTLSSST